MILRLGGERMAKNTVTKYFFNGVPLPPIPNWNTSEWPYGEIRTQFEGDENPAFWFITYSKRPKVVIEDGCWVVSFPQSSKVQQWIMFAAWDYWLGPFDYDMDQHAGYEYVYWLPDKTLHIWSNFNINDEDGICVHPATSYSQKYEEEVDNSEFIRGLQVGISLHGVLHIKTHWQPTEFVLEASKWNGTTYTISLSGYTVVDPPQVGLPLTTTYYNTIRVVDAGLTIPQASETTVVISAKKIPTEDITVAIWGLEASTDATAVSEVSESE